MYKIIHSKSEPAPSVNAAPQITVGQYRVDRQKRGTGLAIKSLRSADLAIWHLDVSWLAGVPEWDLCDYIRVATTAAGTPTQGPMAATRGFIVVKQGCDMFPHWTKPKSPKAARSLITCSLRSMYTDV
jgi:hypothetical protein